MLFDEPFDTNIDQDCLLKDAPGCRDLFYEIPGFMTVQWFLEPEVRSYGIKDIGIRIISISGSFEIDQEETRSGEPEELVINTGDDWTFEVDADLGYDMPLTPQEVELDFKNKIAKVIF